MKTVETIKKFIRSSSVLEKAALELYERLPFSVQRKVFLGSSFIHWMALLQESESWDKNRVIAYQFEQLKSLLKHAMNNISYYRKLFSDSGFNPLNMKSLDDIRVLPYLDKEIIRDGVDEFTYTSMPRKRIETKQTSGSTGIPLSVRQTKESKSIFLAFRANLFRRVGHTPKCREVMFWSMIETGRKKNMPFLQYGNKLILSNRYLTDEWLIKFTEMMRKFKPEYLLGFPSTVSVLSACIKNKGLLPCENLKAVIVYAETLHDWQRVLIEEVFGVRVFSMYAMTELCAIGSECEYSYNIHLHPLYGLTEFAVLERGNTEIVATGFTNYAMPFIRYKTGDIIGEKKEYCPGCGRYHQVVDRIEGRINDFLINKEGGIIPGLMPWIEIFPNTKRYQFFQEEPGKAFLKIVRAETYSQSDTVYITSKLKEMLGPMKDSIHMEIVFVDHILETSGKCKLVDQRLNIKQYLQV